MASARIRFRHLVRVILLTAPVLIAEEKIGPEGMTAFFDKLQIDPLSITSLVFAWKLKAKVPCEFSRSEFVNGCVALEADSMEKLQRCLRTSMGSISVCTYVRCMRACFSNQSIT